MTKQYDCFGLAVGSAFPLPCTATRSTSPDVHIERDDIVADRFDDGDRSEITIEQHEIHLQIADIGRFTVREGKRITVDACHGAPDHELQSYLLGSVFGMLLHQREAFVLHASTVTLDDQMIALIGERTQGKSTLAAALVSNGGQLVADDKSVLEIDAPAVDVRPGPPVLKLAPATADSLDGPLDAVSGTLRTGKRLYRLPKTRLDVGALDRIYVLEDGAGEPTIDPIPPAEQVETVMRHIYLPELVGETGRLERHFAESVTVARHIPVKRLAYPRRMDALAATRETIVGDLT